MNTVNTLPTERFAVAESADITSITNTASSTGWFQVGKFRRLCGLISIGTVAGANTLTIIAQRADDASGTNPETAAALGTYAAVASTTVLVNYDLDKEKGDEKQFVRLTVTGGSANAVQLGILALGFDPMFAPASLLNDSNVTVL